MPQARVCVAHAQDIVLFFIKLKVKQDRPAMPVCLHEPNIVVSRFYSGLLNPCSLVRGKEKKAAFLLHQKGNVPTPE